MLLQQTCIKEYTPPIAHQIGKKKENRKEGRKRRVGSIKIR
jgi:hypothetical protein